MNPLQFYRLAIRMEAHAASESTQRTVVGRLYYGLHHEACCRYYRVNPLACPLERVSRHKSLVEKFNQPADTKSLKVAFFLRRLRYFRTIVDYELGQLYWDHNPVTASEVMNMATETAKRLIVALENYSPGEAPDGCSCPVK